MRSIPFALLLALLLLPDGVLARPLPSAPTSGPPGLALSAAPRVVDVGDAVSLTLGARRWPGAASARVSFVSRHHGFAGPMFWKVSCSCFGTSVGLAKRIHSLETARATAKVTIGRTTFTASTVFSIRGLAANGKDYARGGQIFLTVWVADPRPAVHQDEHICGWVMTADGLGVPGYRIHFTLRYSKTTQSWYSRKTDRTGVACSQRKVLPVTGRQTVRVEGGVGKLRSSTSFTASS